MILQIIQLIKLCEEDKHPENHEFLPLSYCIYKKQMKKVDSQITQKKHKFDICYKCVIKQRKLLKIQANQLKDMIHKLANSNSLNDSVLNVINIILDI